jgi:polyhydroxybutyrate depolymerase
MAVVSGYDGQAEERGVIVAYPDAIRGAWVITTGPPNPDEQLMAALVEALAARLPLDRGRVYAAGYSNGGGMVYRLGCDQAMLFAALASVAGAMVVRGCRPARPIPLLEVHSTGDDVVPYGGDQQGLPSTEEGIARWRALGCPAELYRIDGGSHAWPPVATALTLDFLLSRSLASGARAAGHPG